MLSSLNRRDSTPINRIRRPSSSNNGHQKRYKTEYNTGPEDSRQGLKKLLGSLKKGIETSALKSIRNKILYSCDKEECWQVKDQCNKLIIRTNKVAVRK